MCLKNIQLTAILFAVIFGFFAIWDAQMKRAGLCAVSNQESIRHG